MGTRGARHRWSVAFPIVESYSIIGTPKAKEVLDEEGFKHLFHYTTGILRPLLDRERDQIASLEIEKRDVANEWIDFEADVEKARRSELPPSVVSKINEDLALNAFEGVSSEMTAKIRSRCAYLADQFIRDRRRLASLKCDDCGFNPSLRVGDTGVNPRSLLDVHHKNPLGDGPRNTTLADFALLCPTCHRLVHALLRIQIKRDLAIRAVVN